MLRSKLVTTSVAIALSTICVLLFLPLIRHGYPNTGDSRLHLFWHGAFFETLKSGVFYPRWLHGAVWNLGAPVFYYYPPLPFYVSALMEWLFPSDRLPWIPLGLAVVLALVLSQITCFLWLKRRFRTAGAFVGAVAYGIVPYHLAIDVFFRAAYAEIWAFTWMPLVLFGLDLMKGNRLRGFAYTSIALTLLLISHLPSALLFFPIAFCYGAWSARSFEGYGWLVAAFASGVIGSGIYLVPALTMVDLMQPGKLWGDALEFYFLPKEIYWSFATHGFDHNGSIFIHHLALFPTLVILSASLIILLRKKPVSSNDESRRDNMLDWFWMVMALLMIFMVSPISIKIWDWIPVLRKVQFPWRFNTPLCLCVAWFSTWLWVKSARGGLQKHALLVALATTLAVTVFVAADPALYDRTLTRDEIDSRMGGAEFLPAEAPFPNHPKGWARMFDLPRASAEFGDPQGKVSIDQWVSGHIELTYSDASPDDRLTVAQFYFPLWRATHVDTGRSLPIEADPSSGLLVLQVPPGDGKVSLRMVTSLPERIGAWMSGSFIAVLLLLSIYGIARRRSGTSPPTGPPTATSEPKRLRGEA